MFPIVAWTLFAGGMVYVVFFSYNNYSNYIRMTQVEQQRVQEGLPNQVTLTPEDLRQNPELVEIFDITDIDSNFNLDLEATEHMEYFASQEHMNWLEKLMEIIGHFFN
jgi:hypothetical protein